MTNVAGTTTNGFTYEAEYERTHSDRVTWSATYRRDGILFGMRHGRVDELLGVSLGEVQEAVMDDIEFALAHSS